MKLIGRLQEFTTGRRVLVLLPITMFLYMTILFYTIPSVTARAPGTRLFDMSPGGYSQTDAESLLAAIGPEGRHRLNGDGAYGSEGQWQEMLR